MSHSMRRALHGRAWTTAAAPTLACAALFAGGCARLPPTGAKATGEPLVVDTRTHQESYVTQQKVGEVVHRTSSGRYVTTGVYESQLMNMPVISWQALQGKEKIDDQDFFRIGGDADAAKEIAAMRDSGVTLNRVGLAILMLGGAAAVSGFVLMQTEKETGSYGSGALPLWTVAVAYGGLFTAVTGGSMALYGRWKTKREHPIDDPERAKRVADKYNASIGAGAAPAPAEPKQPPLTKGDGAKQPASEARAPYPQEWKTQVTLKEGEARTVETPPLGEGAGSGAGALVTGTF